ncbi:hypothetical protein CEXT_422141 [Caerostris extrusa]|uniref:Uncharacterized protein n=1 Tax=Caerostris extrusa TaxID=172846 RepID=A0AAV4QEU7_CAEEX|nr:hypothetical protein CEXT_422141 [Caerostris extrusa]
MQGLLPRPLEREAIRETAPSRRACEKWRHMPRKEEDICPLMPELNQPPTKTWARISSPNHGPPPESRVTREDSSHGDGGT